MSKKTSDAIGDMLASGAVPPEVTGGDPAPAEPVQQDSVPPVSQDLNTDTPVGSGDAPPADTPPAPTAPDPRDAQLAAMAEQMRQMQEKLAYTEGRLESLNKPKKDETPTQPQKVPSYFTPDEVKAVTEEGLDGPQMLELMNRAIDRAVNHGMQAVQAQMPQTVSGIVDRKVTESQAITAFYTKNADLVENAPLVGMVAQKVAAENPKFTLPEILKHTAIETRKLLKLPEPAAGGEAPPAVQRVPAKMGGQPSGAGGRQGGPGNPQPAPKSGIQAQIDQLFNPA